jgi:stress response protein YsnF
MSDTSKAFQEEPSTVDDVIHVLEERLTVAKRRRAMGSVKVGTRTELVEAVAEADLDRYRVEVTRVPIGRVVDEAPAARAEGDVTVIPVIEERLVVVKQLFLVEEVRIRHVLERETVTESVRLRRQHAVVERLDGPGARMRRGDADDPAHN